MKIKASFDDATAQDVRVADLMRKYDIETVFYWPFYPERANELQGRTSLSEQQMKDIAEDFEIGSHTLTHPLLTRIKPELAYSEISNSREALSDRFDQNIISFCYPRGYSNPQIQQMVVEAGYLNARSTLVGYVHQSENPYFEQTAVHVSCARKEYAGLDWFDYALKLLAIAEKIPDSIFHFFGHSWEIDKNNDWAKLEKMLKALQ